MAKYLDLSGLTYLVNELKSRFITSSRKINNKPLSSDITLYGSDIVTSTVDQSTVAAALHARIKTINGRGPDASGDVFVRENAASIAMSELIATIAVADWTTVTGGFKVRLTNENITQTMRGVDQWLETDDPIFCNAEFETGYDSNNETGYLDVTVPIKPSAQWVLHVFLAEPNAFDKVASLQEAVEILSIRVDALDPSTSAGIYGDSIDMSPNDATSVANAIKARVLTVNNLSPDINGNVTIDTSTATGTVQSVNNVQPDGNGNVTLTGPDIGVNIVYSSIQPANPTVGTIWLKPITV